MYRQAYSVLLAGFLFFLGGCATSRLMREGDRNMAASRPSGAASYYEQALGKKPNLITNKKFMAKLDRANCLAAYEEGQTAASKGQWDKAVEMLSESLRIDPEFSKGRTALRHAKQQAAELHYRQALAYDQRQLKVLGDDN